MNKFIINKEKISEQSEKKIDNKSIFIDRDGVINVNRHDYVKSWDEFVFLPETKEAIKLVNETDWLLIIITNQSPIGRGIFTQETLDGIHTKMLKDLDDFGCTIDAIYYCPHQPNDNCNCRKPKPGLILQAAKDFKISLADSWMLGDAESDLEAGRAAGCKIKKVNEQQNLLKIIKQILI